MYINCGLNVIIQTARIHQVVLFSTALQSNGCAYIPVDGTLNFQRFDVTEKKTSGFYSKTLYEWVDLWLKKS